MNRVARRGPLARAPGALKRKNFRRKVSQCRKTEKGTIWDFPTSILSQTSKKIELFFGFHQMVSPSFVPIFCNTMDVKKSQRVPPFTIFGTVTLFENLISKIFSRIFKKSLKGPFIFFSYFAINWNFKKPEGSPLLQFCALDIAPTLAVPGLFP